jgi:DNA-directed RNA polymerase subunit H (RpoH/RPB5)
MSELSSIFKTFTLIYKSRINILDMLQDRGYDTSSLREFTENELRSLVVQHNNGKFPNKSEIGPLDIYLSKKNHKGEDEKIYVKYRLDEKFKKTENLSSQISEIYANHLSQKDTLIILNISRVIIKPTDKDKTDEEFVKMLYLTKGHFVQIFGLENFLFNVSKHRFVSKHIPLTNKEVVEMAKHFNITNLKNLPEIERSDPQAKYIGLRPKQVCKIIVKNITNGETYNYRICKN